MRATAASSRAFAPSPYTVSVGKATRPPERSSSAARTMSSCSLRDILSPVTRHAARIAPHQPGMNQIVDVAVQHAIHVADGQLAAEALHKPTGSQHVVTNLAAEVDVQLGILELVLLGALFRHLMLVQARLELLHGAGAVFVLGPLVLALDHDAGRNVREANRRLRAVDVLAAGAAGPEHVHLQVFGLNVDFDVVVDLRVHED